MPPKFMKSVRGYARRGKSVRPTGALGYAVKAYKLAKGVRKLINVEYKNFDTTLSTAVSTTGQFNNLSQIIQGDDFNQREGRSIKLSSIYLRFRYSLNASADRDSIRTIVFIDNDPQGSTPTATDILTSDNPMSFRQRGTDQGRFVILYDNYCNLSTAGGLIKAWKFYKRFKSHHIKFDGTAATDTAKGTIWLYAVGTQPTNTTAHATVIRLTYIDN